MTYILKKKSFAKLDPKVNPDLVYKVPPLDFRTTQLATTKSKTSRSSFVDLKNLSWTAHGSIPRRRTRQTHLALDWYEQH